MKQVLILAGAAAFAFTAPAVAKPGNGQGDGHGHGYGYSDARGHGHGHGDDVDDGDGHRYGYNGPVGYGVGGCPPGLAKKNNGCLPPGQAKKLYGRGQRLPVGYGTPYAYNRIPYDVRSRYGLPAYGSYYYGDGYLYRVDPRTMLVQDAIATLLR
jgi:hypothetical protein